VGEGCCKEAGEEVGERGGEPAGEVGAIDTGVVGEVAPCITPALAGGNEEAGVGIVSSETAERAFVLVGRFSELCT
jgi:hypothetical protein